MENRIVKYLEGNLDPLFFNAIKNKFFSAASLAVIKKKDHYSTSFTRCYGLTSFGPVEKIVNKKTIFDLASLTKPFVTTLCILHLIDKGIVNWDDTLNKYFSKIENKNKVTIEKILSHSSGFVSYKPYYKNFDNVPSEENKIKLINYILSDKLDYIPGNNTIYSDLGFILLGSIIEKVSDMSLDIYFNKYFTEPLNLNNDLYFINLCIKKDKKRDTFFAATEKCEWRKKIIQGEVHDEHAWLTGGIAGHAGLFGTINGVMGLCEYILDKWKGKNSEKGIVLHSLNKALSKRNNTSTWCYGFDTPSPFKSSAGKLISPSSVGHLGFTGTSFWIDPIRDLIIILLTNRIHPNRNNISIREFRPVFHDTVFRIFDYK
jgi:CubicO group peptidase (beta-lactamase class C family)